MTIKDIVDRKGTDVLTIRPSATVRDVVDRMREKSVAALVVNSGDAIMGIVSERDVVSSLSRFGEQVLSKTVRDILPRNLVAIAPGDSVKHAMRLMTNHRVRHLPVVTGGKLVGIVSIGDLVKSRLEDLETESNVLRDVYIAAR